MKLLTQMVFLLALVAYVAVGGIVFHLLESQNETESVTMASELIRTFIENNTCVTPEEIQRLLTVAVETYRSGQIVINNTAPEPVQENWDYYSAIFFAMTVVTTIGYGTISPVTANGQIFCMVFAIIGIPLFLVVASTVGLSLYKLMSKCQKCCFKPDENDETSKGAKICGGIFYTLLGIGFLLVVPAVIFVVMEDWSFRESFYYTIVTLTTVGFGDFVAGSSDDHGGFRGIYRLCVAAWILLGLTWMAGVISAIQDFYSKALEDKDETASKSARSSRRNSRSEGRTHGVDQNNRLRQINQNNLDIYSNGQLYQDNQREAERYLYDPPPRSNNSKELVRMFSRDVQNTSPGQGKPPDDSPVGQNGHVDNNDILLTKL